MPTYAIGDVQGCFQPLCGLLEQIEFDAARDRLWFVGDLVNRGPDSLATLRFVKGLGQAAVCVLGNHDLHLVAVAEGHAKLRKDDTLEPTLEAPDRDGLLAWLRSRPLMHAEGEFAMVHAGLLPAWTISRALDLAHEVEEELRAPTYDSLLARMYGNEPSRWSEKLAGYARLRVIVNAMTRMRVCTRDGSMDLRYKGDSAELPAGLLPWFAVPARASRGSTAHLRTLVSVGSGPRAGRDWTGYRMSVGAEAVGAAPGRSPTVPALLPGRGSPRAVGDRSPPSHARCRGASCRARPLCRRKSPPPATSVVPGSDVSTPTGSAYPHRTHPDPHYRRHGRSAVSITTTRAPAPSAGWNREAWNGLSSVPSVVVPSGNTATCSPRVSASTIARLVRIVSCRFWRSMKIVPAPDTRNPTTGQRRMSDFATKRTGTTELTTQMSSQDTWLLTISVGAWPDGSEPCTLHAQVQHVQELAATSA